MPLLDPRLQRAIKSFPELVMAGACLPDLAIVSHRYRHTHLWENAHQLMLTAHSDEELAIAIGYASHLYVDVIAHIILYRLMRLCGIKMSCSHISHQTGQWMAI